MDEINKPPIKIKFDISGNWIDAKKKPPRKDTPIVVYLENHRFPYVVIWIEDETYGETGFFEGNLEYCFKEIDIMYWIPAPPLYMNFFRVEE